ncbi:MAG TPA: ParB/RepB/Spo0J family partition protein [Gammaproteobacteria bacterium]|nr:ParB/RepB/Spo0J family partition protein [Gammaproteobacteria bacterium]
MVKKRGLGKSLDALLTGSGALSDYAEKESRETLAMLPIASIQRGKYQPRRDMNPEALEDLANSIRAQGVIQPIVVRHLSGGRYEIVAGERRWRASQQAGLTEIPAIIKDIPDEAAIAIALIENIQREDLNPMEEAMALQRLLDEFAMTHQAVADAVGKSRASVTNLLRLLALSPEVKTLLEHGDIEMGHARALLALPEASQVDAAMMIVEKNLSVRETEELVRRMQLPNLPSMPKAIDPDIRRLQQDLANRLKLMVAINCNPKGKGKVVIRYNNLEELDTILEYFQ